MGFVDDGLLVLLPDVLDHFREDYDIEAPVLERKICPTALSKGKVRVALTSQYKGLLVYVNSDESVGTLGDGVKIPPKSTSNVEDSTGLCGDGVPNERSPIPAKFFEFLQARGHEEVKFGSWTSGTGPEEPLYRTVFTAVPTPSIICFVEKRERATS
jgi:hypothetical protein